MNFFIINPASQKNSALKLWHKKQKKVQKLFPDSSFLFTKKKGDATKFVRKLCTEQRAPCFIIVGGDGTVGEAVNGAFDRGFSLNPNATFGVLPAGTGNDFAKNLGLLEGFDSALSVLLDKKTQLLDVGYCEFQKGPKGACDAYFLNGFSCGVGAVAAQKVEKFKSFLGSKGAYFASACLALLFHRPYKLFIKTLGKKLFSKKLHSLSIANGRFFGGGMKIAPEAKMSDGKFNVVVFENMSKLSLLFNLPRVYWGGHLRLRSICHFVAESIELRELVEKGINCELDGEVLFSLPSRVTCLKKAIRFISPA